MRKEEIGDLTRVRPRVEVSEAVIPSINLRAEREIIRETIVGMEVLHHTLVTKVQEMRPVLIDMLSKNLRQVLSSNPNLSNLKHLREVDSLIFVSKIFFLTFSLAIIAPETAKKKKFVWTDADESDMREYYLNEKRSNQEDG